MSAAAESGETTSSLALDLSRSDIPAGAEFTVRAWAPYDLEGFFLQIRDADGALVAIVPFTEFDEHGSSTEAVTLTAPLAAADYSWQAIVTEGETADDEAASEELVSEIAFTVKPLVTSLLTWDIPATVIGGETFRFKVGLKCIGYDRQEEISFDIHDHTGALRHTGSVSSEIWPGSDGLHYTEVAFDAPDEIGLHKWTVTVAGSEENPPRLGTSTGFGLRVVPRPECKVRVFVSEVDGQTPIQGAIVQLHPYKTRTGEDGFAEFDLPKGSYTALVSKARHEAVNQDVEVSGDKEVSIRLAWEPPEDPFAHYNN